MEYLWITRWAEFQHYRPERDRPPAWIKDYPKQMHDERYLQLSDRQRAVLGDVRRSFALTFGRLPDDTRTISRHRHRQTRRDDLEALVNAGFLEVISRETLEQRLEDLYSSPRAPARSKEREVERETPLPPFTKTDNGRPIACPECGLTFKAQTTLAEHRYHSHDGPEPEHWLSAEARSRTED